MEENNMELQQIITGIFLGLVAIGLGIYVSFTARCKGPIFSNTYLWLSKEEREKADKKKEYKLVTVIFSGLSAFFALDAIYIFTLSKAALILGFCIMAFIIIYAIIDAVKSQRF